MKLFKNQAGFNDVVTITIIGGIIGAIFIVGVFVWQEYRYYQREAGLIQIISLIKSYNQIDTIDDIIEEDGNTTKSDFTDFGSKIVYTTSMSEDIELLKADCASRGGKFKPCGLSCAPDAEICIKVCAYTCEDIPIVYDNSGATCQTDDDCKCRISNGSEFLEGTISGVCCVDGFVGNRLICNDDVEKNTCGQCLYI